MNDYKAGDLCQYRNIIVGTTTILLLAPSKESPLIWKCLDLTNNVVRLIRLGTPATTIVLIAESDAL
jgi:hypothetical protein